MSDPITRLNAALEGRYRIEREGGDETARRRSLEHLTCVSHGRSLGVPCLGNHGPPSRRQKRGARRDERRDTVCASRRRSVGIVLLGSAPLTACSGSDGGGLQGLIRATQLQM